MKSKGITIKEIAEIANVGTGTVSRVINGGVVSEETRRKIEEIMAENNYVPNSSAAALRKKKVGIVALLVPMISVPFFSKTAYYVESFLADRHYKMMVISSQNEKEKELDVFSMLQRGQVDGLIFLTSHEHDFDFTDIPAVTIDRHLTEKIPYVTSSNYQSTFQALEKLYASGARKIGFLGGCTTIETEVTKRYDAYMDFIKQYNLDPRVHRDLFEHGEEELATNDFMEMYPDVDAVFASSDIFGICLLKEAAKRGKTVPTDLQIISYDGVVDEMTERTLTTIKQDVKTMSKKAVDLLFAQFSNVDVLIENIIPTQLRKGDTTL